MVTISKEKYKWCSKNFPGLADQNEEEIEQNLRKNVRGTICRKIEEMILSCQPGNMRLATALRNSEKYCIKERYKV